MILIFRLLRLFPTISNPADSAQQYLANLDIVNRLMGHITVDTIDPTYSDTVTDSNTLTTHVISGIHYDNVAGLSGRYTCGDIEQSIYQLLGDEDVKNALQSFNMGQLVTSLDGSQVGLYNGVFVDFAHANTTDSFWLTLHDGGLI